MNVLDKKRIEKELMQVTAARFDMEIRIEEMNQQIAELQKYIQIQLNKEEELKEKITKEGN